MAARNIEAIFRFLDIFMLGFTGELVVIRELHQNALTKSPPGQRSAPGTVSHTIMKLETLVILTTDLLLDLFLPAFP